MKNTDGFYLYVSTRACYDPAKTIFIFAPGEMAGDISKAEQFARESGWQALAEYDGAVLILPLAPKGWKEEMVSLPGIIFDRVRSQVESRNGKSLFGRDGKIWCWETMIYLAGYGDGAVFAGNCVVAEPARFAAAALVGGAPDDYSAGGRSSSHWLVRNVSSDYAVRNDQIPSSLWLIGAPVEAASQALEYFGRAGGFGQQYRQIVVGELSAICYENEKNPAERLLLSEETALCGISLAHTILEDYFEHTIRWKNGPDGTLSLHLGRTGFYQSPRFSHHSVTVGCLEYAYSVHLPQGYTAEQVQGMPVVFSVHGRGEPAWLFAEKNGWDMLADETGAFVLVCPDSPGNIWQFERDGLAFEAMIHQLCVDYQLDETRVYLTGFSNGGAITREVGTAFPQLFAAIAPYNAPVNAPGLVADEMISPGLLASGYELPYWVYVGDNDPAAGTDVEDQLEIMLAANGCQACFCQRRDSAVQKPCRFDQRLDTTGQVRDYLSQELACLSTRLIPDEIRTGENYYTITRGYDQGDRFKTLIYYGKDGKPRVGFTVMKNMPHGAICEQSRAAWEFLRHFRRPAGSRQVEYLPE